MTTLIASHTRRFPTMLLAVLLVAVSVLAGCSGADGASDQNQADSAAAANEGERVETLILKPTQFADVIEVTGTIDAVDDATLSAQTSGTVVALANLGDHVARGAAVAQLDPQIPQAAVEQARASLEAAQAQMELAEDNYNRQAPLYRDSIISAIEYENVRAQLNQARAQVAQAEAALSSARKQLQNTFVSTPFSGIVEQHFVQRGEQVSPGMPVARVVNTSRVRMKAGVPERYAGDINVGTPVEMRLNAYNVGSRLGRVSFVGSAIDSESRTFPIEVELDNSDRRLKPQMVAQVLVTRHDLSGVLVVPRDAVLRDELGNAVFVVSQADNGRMIAARRSVQIGASYGGRVLIQDGLEAGDEVVVSGQSVLTDGDIVRIISRSEQDPAMALEDSAAE